MGRENCHYWDGVLGVGVAKRWVDFGVGSLVIIVDEWNRVSWLGSRVKGWIGMMLKN